ASSKWNFSNVNPGLVGGHCIGVDPYYLLNRATSKGIKLPLVETARQINEVKSERVAHRILEIARTISGSHNPPNILLLGFSYKPNTSDIRNTKVADVIKWLQNKCNVDCFDPLVDIEQAYECYGITLSTLENIQSRQYELIVLMVPHDILANMDFSSIRHIDIKEIL
ncbi:UDP binding domain-containing protein, partial [Phocaeicola dorei]|uniref:UDP binding domain-containing protein n=1 Tax=Phocaeicola dorei TaxID=357276 RepID=UPI003F21B6CA